MNFDEIIRDIKRRDPGQSEFLQAVTESLVNLGPLFNKHPNYLYVLPSLCEPDKVVQFRVNWVDDDGETRVNRGYCVQFNQVLGPCKGGIRFSKHINLSKIKFLAFEQSIKNALSTYCMGGSMSGSDFDPTTKTPSEIQRYCMDFVTELLKHCPNEAATPIGDIGVGSKELCIMFGQYKRVQHASTTALNGKGWGVSLGCPEATGYGLVYALNRAVRDKKGVLAGKKILISGSGKVALAAGEKCIELGATLLSFSDSSGTIFEVGGFTCNQLRLLTSIKNKKGRCADYKAFSKTVKYFDGTSPWHIHCDIALPCAIENELDVGDARNLAKCDCRWVFEGSNMSCTPEAIDLFRKCNVNYFPSKAGNVGGIALAGLEASLNSTRVFWSKLEMEEKLKTIMENVYRSVSDAAKELGRPNDFLLGANAVGIRRLAETMIAQGYVNVR